MGNVSTNDDSQDTGPLPPDPDLAIGLLPGALEEHAHVDGHTVPSESIAKLLAHSALEAQHDSDIVSLRTPRMHSKTRGGVNSALDAWITSPLTRDRANSRSSLPKSFLWLSGPNGAGKTSIQRELAMRCHKDGRLLASFFFNSQSTRANNERAFVATLAYQIASNIPGLWDFVSSAIQDDPEIFKRSLESQMLCLVFWPLERFLRYSRHNYWWRRLKSTFNAQRGRPMPEKFRQCKAFKERFAEWSSRNIVVVDAIDECNDLAIDKFGGVGQQRHIIGLMHWASVHRTFPLRFVASSPVNSNIAKAFYNSFKMPRGRVNIDLERAPAGRDMVAYLQAEFERIRTSHLRIGVRGDEQEWPSPSVVDMLAAKASNTLFIYVSTVIKFVDNPHHNPVETLDRLVDSIAQQSTVDSQKSYAELDVLYTIILHPPPETNGDVTAVLRKLVHSIARKQFQSALELDECLSLTPGTASNFLHDSLCSLVYVHAPTSALTSGVGNIGFYHQSMLEFMASEERSGDMQLGSAT